MNWLDTDVDDAAERFHQYVREGCRLSMPKRHMIGGHPPAYWWNAEIAELRRTCISKRRVFQRWGTRGRPREEERADYIDAKKKL